jgi:hypothetical protein
MAYWMNYCDAPLHSLADNHRPSPSPTPSALVHDPDMWQGHLYRQANFHSYSTPSPLTNCQSKDRDNQVFLSRAFPASNSAQKLPPSGCFRPLDSDQSAFWLSISASRRASLDHIELLNTSVRRKNKMSVPRAHDRVWRFFVWNHPRI